MINKKIINLLTVSVLLLVLFSSLNSVSAVRIGEVFDEFDYRNPVIKEIDCNVDGSITPQSVNITSDDGFDYIGAVIFHISWVSNFIFFDSFGTDDPLENGTLVQYDFETLNSPLVSFHSFARVMFDMEILSDDRNPKNNHMIARVLFANFVDPLGLKIKDGHTLSFVMQDNITAVVDSFDIIVGGWKLIERDVGIRYDFIEDVYAFDDLIDIPLSIVMLPLALIFSGDEMLSLFGLAVGLAYAVMIVELLGRTLKRK